MVWKCADGGALCVVWGQNPDSAASHQADADPRPAIPSADRGQAAGFSGKHKEGGFINLSVNQLNSPKSSICLSTQSPISLSIQSSICLSIQSSNDPSGVHPVIH